MAVASAALIAGCIPTGPPDEWDTPSPTAAARTSDAPSPPASATASPGPAATAAPSATPSPSRTQTEARPCPAYDDGLDVDYVAIDGHRYSAICTGMTFEEASAAVPEWDLEPEAICPWVAEIVAADPLYVQAISDPADPDGPIRLFRMIYLADPETAPPHEVPATAEGISLGSSVADVLVSYAGARQVVQEDPSRGTREQYVVDDGGGHWLVFDIAGEVVSEVTWGLDLEAGIAGELCSL